MATSPDQPSSNQASTPYPNIPPLIDSRETEYRDTGITSSVAILGHPIHPVVVIFPVAFLSAAAGTDLGYWLTKGEFWARASVWLLGSGLLTAIAAAIIGIVDFIRIPRVRNRQAGWAHMWLNVGVLALTLVNFGLRLVGTNATILPFGISLSGIVAALLMLSGWYGGELTFRHKVGIIGPGESQIL